MMAPVVVAATHVPDLDCWLPVLASAQPQPLLRCLGESTVDKSSPLSLSVSLPALPPHVINKKRKIEETKKWVALAKGVDGHQDLV